MRKILFILTTLLFALPVHVEGRTTIDTDAIWHEFRQNHPYGYQTVGLKHVGDDCVFIISEPSERVSERSLQGLFANYGGNFEIKKHKLGYDGWLADVVGSAHFKGNAEFDAFTDQLFKTLYGTAYKPYYLNLDNPIAHVYYSPYRLNYSISAAELNQWIIKDKELFENGRGEKKTVEQLVASNMSESNAIWYGEGFVAWVVQPGKVTLQDELFCTNARKFAIDSDLIIGAVGVQGKRVAIIARSREVPLEILPPLRIETLLQLAVTDNDHLAQSYERFHLFAGKTADKLDIAPIYLSDELWHTEYGNLLNITDQMLKSWSENGRIEYTNFGHPKPIDWGFDRGALRDLESSTLTYNWNTAGAGFIFPGPQNLSIYSVNRTGSLPVSYIPEGMEGTEHGNKVFDAEELAYDFFSELNSPELARVVQYAAFYQIFRYYRGDEDYHADMTEFCTGAPSYKVYEPIVERLFHIVDEQAQGGTDIEAGYERFAAKAREKSVSRRLQELLKNDPHNEFRNFLVEQESAEYVDSLLHISAGQEDEDIRKEYDSYLSHNIGVISKYIDNYKKENGRFSFEEAAHYAVCPRAFRDDIKKEMETSKEWKAYHDKVDIFNRDVEDLNRRSDDLSKRIDQFNADVEKGNATFEKRMSLSLEQNQLLEEQQKIRATRKLLDDTEEYLYKKISKKQALLLNDEQSKALGALNWLLTDPGTNYDEPIGEFFADKMEGLHKHWTKGPSVASSSNGTGYGGHNLDAKVTPVKFENNLRRGTCKITSSNGWKYISVRAEDIDKLTSSFIRKIHRQDIEGISHLPEKAPEIRRKSEIVSSTSLTPSDPPVTMEKSVYAHGLQIEDFDSFQMRIVDEIVRTGGSSVREIVFNGFTPNSVNVKVDGLKDAIVTRAEELKIKMTDFEVDDISMVKRGNDRFVVVIPIRESSTLSHIKDREFHIDVPESIGEDVRSTIKSMSEENERNLDNIFKIIHGIKSRLPEINLEQIKPELKGQVFTLIIYENNDFLNYAA